MNGLIYLSFLPSRSRSICLHFKDHTPPPIFWCTFTYFASSWVHSVSAQPWQRFSDRLERLVGAGRESQTASISPWFIGLWWFSWIWETGTIYELMFSSPNTMCLGNILCPSGSKRIHEDHQLVLINKKRQCTQKLLIFSPENLPALRKQL